MIRRALLSLLLSSTVGTLGDRSFAQAPSPAQMGITPQTPQVVQVLDKSKTWVPIGSVDVNHVFTLVGGQNTGQWLMGVDPTGAVDATDPINAALASSTKCWFLPAGTYKIHDQLTGKLGGCLKGDGSRTTIFNVNSTTFNMSAKGAFFFPSTGGQSFTLTDVGFEYTQPQTSVRASLAAFPPAIYAQNAGRMKLERIYFGAPSICLDARGNAGGAYIYDIECGAYTMGMSWDGSLDTVRIVNWHQWPFGNMNIGSTPLHSVYDDGQVGCFNIGRIDGLNAVNWGCFQASGQITSAAPNWLANQFANLSMDGYGASLRIDGGYVVISNGYSTAGELDGAHPGTRSNLAVNGGVVDIVNWDIHNGFNNVPTVNVAGGEVRVSNSTWVNYFSPHLLNAAGGSISTSNTDLTCNSGVTGTCIEVNGGNAQLDHFKLGCSNTAVTCGHAANGTLEITNSRMAPVFGTTWTAPYVLQDNTAGAFLRFRGNYFNIAGAGEGVHFSGDGNLNQFAGNNMAGWTFTIPNVRTSTLSQYEVKERYTVAGLNSGIPCAGAAMGMEVIVTDATSPTYNGTLTGGGTAVVKAICDAAGSWRSH